MSSANRYWTKAWNPVTGCWPCSPACERCWAQSLVRRFPHLHSCRGDFASPALHGWRLEGPRHWRRPQVVATCWLGDLWYQRVPLDWRRRIADTIAASTVHEFLLLTKRPEALTREWTRLPNAWLGLSVWDQASWMRAMDEFKRLADVRRRAARFWISAEPLLGPIRPRRADVALLDWLVIGCETGPGRRPAKTEWIDQLAEAAARAGVPVYCKAWEHPQLGLMRPAPLPAEAPGRLAPVLQRAGVLAA